MGTVILISSACSKLPPSLSNLASNSPESGRFLIKSVNSGLCLDIPGGKTDGGLVLTQFTCNSSNAQVFELKRVRGNAYIIANYNDTMVLDVWGLSKEPGAKIQLWNPTDASNQEFLLESAGGDEYFIRSANSKLVLDVDKVSKEAGAILLQWTKTGGANQRFTFEKVNQKNPDGTRAIGSVEYGMKLVWADEFNGKDVDHSKWNFEVKHPGWVNHELQAYVGDRKENVRVENGHLVIEARKDGFEGNAYTSARLKTEGKASWKYGRFEARIQLPRGVGTWPAFWMMPDDQTGGWPGCGEIDIMEHVGYDQDWIHATTHSNAYSWRSNTQRTAKTLMPGVSDGYHIYALEWSEERIEMFIDGKKFYESANDRTGTDAYPFVKNFHLILNLAVGGDWGGAQGVDENGWPRQMLVDYVRVYQAE